MRILVIEDEKRNFTRLKKLLLQIDKTYEIKGPIDSVEDLKESLETSTFYQLVISDIRIKGGTCFDAFEETKPKVPVIFVTAYDEYALKAFQNNGIAYVQKPIELEELKEAIDKAMKMIAPQDEMKHLLGMLKETKKKYRERFLVPFGDQLQIVNSYSINHLSIENKGTIAYLEDGSSVTINESMNDLESELDPATFFRINRQCIINIDDIVNIEMTWNGKLKLQLRHFKDQVFEVSRERVTDLKNCLDK